MSENPDVRALWPFAVAGRKPLTVMQGAPKRVLVTGLSGRLGQAWVHAKEDDASDELAELGFGAQRAPYALEGLDRRPFPKAPSSLRMHAVDFRSKRIRDLFASHDFDAVVHLGTLHNPRAANDLHFSWNVAAFDQLLQAVAAARIPRLVVVSSADVYGPRSDNPHYLPESAPLLGAQRFQAIRDLVSLDLAAQNFAWRESQVETVVLRPCHVIGSVRNAAGKYFRMRRPPMLAGYDPLVQLLHERDLLHAIQLALGPLPRGVYNVAGPGALRLSELHARLGHRPRRLPATLIRPLAERLWGLGASAFPAEQLDYIRYHCTVDDALFRRLTAFAPRYGLDAMARDLEASAA